MNVEKVNRYLSSPVGVKYVKVKVDSGAAVSVAPAATFDGYKVFPTYESRQGIKYTSASGHKIPDKGIRYPYVRTSTGDVRSLGMRVADVSTPLISVYDIINKDQKVVFDSEGSYVENKNTKQRIKIDWQGHNPVMCFQVLDPVDEDLDAPCLADLEDSSPDGAAPAGDRAENSSQGFRGPARLL
jgi:hypothetical protein